VPTASKLGSSTPMRGRVINRGRCLVSVIGQGRSEKR
jgi:hypothetical protein